MVWGCMGCNSVGKLVEVEGKMDAKQYCEILDEGVVQSFEKLDIEEGRAIFSKTMIQNTPSGWPQLGFQTMISF